MTKFALVFAFCLSPQPDLTEPPLDISFTQIPIRQAARLNGLRVRTAFIVGCPADTADGVTTIGLGEHPDGSERAVHLPENWTIDKGNRVAVEGVLRLIKHPPNVINGQRVEQWIEIRIDGILTK